MYGIVLCTSNISTVHFSPDTGCEFFVVAQSRCSKCFP